VHFISSLWVIFFSPDLLFFFWFFLIGLLSICGQYFCISWLIITLWHEII
jgi:hypothetical protein